MDRTPSACPRALPCGPRLCQSGVVLKVIVWSDVETVEVEKKKKKKKKKKKRKKEEEEERKEEEEKKKKEEEKRRREEEILRQSRLKSLSSPH